MNANQLDPATYRKACRMLYAAGYLPAKEAARNLDAREQWEEETAQAERDAEKLAAAF